MATRIFPSPRQKSTSNQSPLETVVDLAIGRFELTNGLITFAAQKQALNVRGNNLRAQLAYNILSQEYSGQDLAAACLRCLRAKHAGGFHSERAAGASRAIESMCMTHSIFSSALRPSRSTRRSRT